MSRSRSHSHPHHVPPPDDAATQDRQNGAEAGDPGPASISEDDLRALYEIVAKLTEERDQAKDQMLRTMADMQNQRRRFHADREALQKLATEQLIRDLLPVLDNFERTLAAAKGGASLESLTDGVAAVDRQLRTVLEARSFERIPAEGEMFDPDFHEAVAAEETHELPEGSIVQELAPGYRIGDVVIRPSKVRVAKRP